MKKTAINRVKVRNSCGKKGCRIYVLPYGATKERFERFVKFCEEDQKQEEKVIKEL